MTQLTPIQIRKMEYEEAILNLIDHADDFTRSDLQGIISALIQKIWNDEVNILSIVGEYRKAEEQYVEEHKS